MTDDLPTRPFTALPPPPAGAVVAVRAGRSIRRRRRLTGAGAAAACVVLVAGVVAASGAGSTHAEDQLVPARKPTAAAVPSPASAVARPHDAAAATATGAPAARPSTTAGGSAVAGDQGSPTGPEGSTGANRTSSTSYRTPPLRRTYRPAPPTSPPNPQHGPAGRICSASYDDSGNGGAITTDWCVRAIASETARGHDLTIEICRDSTGPDRLTFSRRLEVDLAITSRNKTVWRWSAGHPDATAAHTLDAATDSCWSWTAPWTDVDASGRALDPGSYTLAVTSSAAELRAINAQTTPFSIS